VRATQASCAGPLLLASVGRGSARGQAGTAVVVVPAAAPQAGTPAWATAAGKPGLLPPEGPARPPSTAVTTGPATRVGAVLGWAGNMEPRRSTVCTSCRERCRQVAGPPPWSWRRGTFHADPESSISRNMIRYSTGTTSGPRLPRGTGQQPDLPGPRRHGWPTVTTMGSPFRQQDAAAGGPPDYCGSSLPGPPTGFLPPADGAADGGAALPGALDLRRRRARQRRSARGAAPAANQWGRS
jgi:hypothetical protein